MKTLPNNLHTRPRPLDDWPRIRGVYVYSSIVDEGLQPTKKNSTKLRVDSFQFDSTRLIQSL
jgi:hypothetical protein